MVIIIWDSRYIKRPAVYYTIIKRCDNGLQRQTIKTVTRLCRKILSTKFKKKKRERTHDNNYRGRLKRDEEEKDKNRYY